MAVEKYVRYRTIMRGNRRKNAAIIIILWNQRQQTTVVFTWGVASIMGKKPSWNRIYTQFHIGSCISKVTITKNLSKLKSRQIMNWSSWKDHTYFCKGFFSITTPWFDDIFKNFLDLKSKDAVNYVPSLYFCNKKMLF